MRVWVFILSRLLSRCLPGVQLKILNVTGGVVSRPPYGELTCVSMVIKLLKCFRCSSRRRAYIPDYAYKTLESFPPLSSRQTIATYQRNMSQHCWAQHVACVWPACCDMLRLVGLLLAPIWPFTNLSQQHPTCRNTPERGTLKIGGGGGGAPKICILQNQREDRRGGGWLLKKLNR